MSTGLLFTIESKERNSINCMGLGERQLYSRKLRFNLETNKRNPKSYSRPFHNRS